MSKLKMHIAYTLSIIATVMVFVTNISPANLHTRALQDRGAQPGCSSTCISHVQPAITSEATNKKDKDEKEPSPPVFTWVESPASLLALYVVAFVFFLVSIDRHRGQVLTTRLRF